MTEPARGTRPNLRCVLQPPDRAAIGRILEAAAVFRSEEVAVGLELVDDTLTLGPRSSYRWVVAEVPGEGTSGLVVAGFACFGTVALTEGTYDLYWIAVDPARRGTGLAAALDEAVTATVRREGARWLLAETSSTPPYEPARRFYLRRGYELLGCIPDFYRPGDDRLTYGKRLDRA